MPSKLYVGNLAYSVRNEHLQELFSQAGKVESVAVITDKFSGESKGFGFVEMSDAAEAADVRMYAELLTGAEKGHFRTVDGTLELTDDFGELRMGA